MFSPPCAVVLPPDFLSLLLLFLPLTDNRTNVLTTPAQLWLRTTIYSNASDSVRLFFYGNGSNRSSKTKPS